MNDIKPEFYKTFDISDIARYFNKNSDKSNSDDVIFYEIDSSSHYESQATVRVLGLTIALCLQGEGDVSIGMKNFKFKKNSLMLLNPNQYLHSMRIVSSVKFVVIGCKVDMIQFIIPKLSGLLSLMIHNPMEAVTDLNDEQAANICDYMKYIGRQTLAPSTPIKKTKICSLLQALLCEILEIHYATSDGAVRFQTRKEEIFSKFIAELMENFKKERSVSFYADRLYVTPKHLSSVVKELTTHTAGDIIDHYVIMEAKIMLAESSFTIQEIANNLHFANQSFFGKYFKHLTGYSPSEFRKKASL